MVERIRYNPDNRGPISKRSAPAPVRPLALFGPPLLLEGEDAAAYDELVARMCAAVTPVDVLEEMFVADIVFLQWQILRYHRLETSLISAIGNKNLKTLLPDLLPFHLFREEMEQPLAEALHEKLSKHKGEYDPQELARRCLQEDPEADAKVFELLSSDEWHEALNAAKAEKAEELAQAYARREPDAIKQVNEILAASGQTMDGIIAEALTDRISGVATFDEIERIGRQIASFEICRNASLREIEGRRAVLGATLRRNVQEIEAEDLKVIETTSGGKKRAA